ncbi:unnamed protein product, partial [Amoebophrya sp. A120]
GPAPPPQNLNDEFFEPHDQALINRLTVRSPIIGDLPRSPSSLQPAASSTNRTWEDDFQGHLSHAIESLFKCEETLRTRSDDADAVKEEKELQTRFDELNEEVATLLKERQALETELHDLEGDTEATDFRNKSTQELRRLIQTFEMNMTMV